MAEGSRLRPCEEDGVHDVDAVGDENDNGDDVSL